MTKYGDMIEDHEWTEPEPEADGGERTYIDSHDVEVVYVTDPDPEYPGYGREKYEARITYDDGSPHVLFVVEYRWKGNFWRDTTEWDWQDVPEPVRQQVAAVVPVDTPDDLESGVRLVDEGGESRWEKIHKPRMERMKEDGKTVCTVCGCDLTDPKNGGDPTEDGDWVCRDPHCRGFATAVCGPYSPEDES